MISWHLMRDRDEGSNQDMLAHTSTATAHYSDGGTSEQPRATILLADCHAEYTGDWPKPHGGWPNAYAYMQEINISAIEAAHEALTDARYDQSEEALLPVWERMLPGFSDTVEMTPLNQYAVIWSIEGDVPGHDLVFADLIAKLDVTPGGDDDFFDYWPNTMDMLWHYADDLDRWSLIRKTRTETHRRQVQDLFRRVWDRVDDGSDNRVEWLGRPWAVLEVTA